MPRSKQRKSLDPIESIPFKIYTFYSVTSVTLASPTVNSSNLTPGIDSRLAAIGDVFQWYRFKRLKVHLHPTLAAADVLATVGYLPRVPNTAPTAHNDLALMPASAQKSWSQTVKSTMVVGPDIMLGDTNLKWYQTALGTEDSQFEIQGILYFIGTASVNPSNMIVCIEGICEFKGRSAATQTPLFFSPNTKVLTSGSSPSLKSTGEIDQKNDESTSVVIGGVTYYRSKA